MLVIIFTFAIMKLIRFLLFPVAIIYWLVTTVRNFLFDVGILKSTSFNIPVIAVGNLSVGGTGKTPQIEYLIRLLQNNYQLAVLSRGYKRKTKGFQIVDDSFQAEDVGDEPFQYFQKFKNIRVAVDADRTQGISLLLNEEDKPEVILLDDAFQHRKVNAGFYILLTKYNDLYIHDFLLPTGNLREGRKGAKRADIIIVTKCPKDLSKEKQVEIVSKLRVKKEQQVFFSMISYKEILKGTKKISVNELRNYQVLLVTGIANPTPLLEYLQSLEVKYEHLKFPDHHHFSMNEINEIKKKYQKLNTSQKIILTTEKDYVRLQDKVEELSYIEIETLFIEGEESFKKEILGVVKK